MFKCPRMRVVTVKSAYPFRSWMNNSLSGSIPFLALKVLKLGKLLNPWQTGSTGHPIQTLKSLALHLDSQNPKGHIWLFDIRSEKPQTVDFHQAQDVELARRSGATADAEAGENRAVVWNCRPFRRMEGPVHTGKGWEMRLLEWAKAQEPVLLRRVSLIYSWSL